jgi:cytochrome c
MVSGGLFLSSYYSKRGKPGDIYSRFARDVTEKLTISPSAVLAMGIIPAVSALFAYAQLLYMSESIAVDVLALSVLLFAGGFILAYRYVNSFRTEEVLRKFRNIAGESAIESSTFAGEIREFENNVVRINSSSGLWAKYLLLTAIYLFAGATALASTPSKWASVGNILQLIFSLQTLFNFLAIASFAAVITGGAIMFYFFSWNGGIKNMTAEYTDFVKSVGLQSAYWGIISLPVMLFLSYLYLPSVSTSGIVFYSLIAVLLFIIITGNFLYSTIKTSDTGLSTVVFMLIMILVLFNIVKDQMVFSNAIKNNSQQITKKAEEHVSELKGKLMQSSGINVEAIYNQKCVACHRFDQRLVGPPYNESVPKYNGDVNKLAEFIYNPQKIDPAYPPMPNQGLKKKEATAMAQWLIEQVSKK